MATIFHNRIACWANTQEICRNDQSLIPKYLSIKYTYDPNYIYKQQCEHSNIVFEDLDAIQCATLYNQGNPLILNLCDDNFSGGCVESGSGAQEESLFRRTNYFMTLEQNLYPIKDNEAVYSPDVTVIKDIERNGWRLYPNGARETFSFIACPGIKYPSIIHKQLGNNETEKRLKPEDVERLKIKIKLIIQLANQYNHDTIILGALGCGAWRCPAKHVAEVFKEVLKEHDGHVKNYVFAILNTKGDLQIMRHPSHFNKKSTCSIFQEVFNNV